MMDSFFSKRIQRNSRTLFGERRMTEEKKKWKANPKITMRITNPVNDDIRAFCRRIRKWLNQIKNLLSANGLKEKTV